MACPFFRPDQPLDARMWVIGPRMPLGDAYGGTCHTTAEVVHPSENQVRDLCNCGYARGRCDRFPETAAEDAVRFSVSSIEGDRIRLVWIIEGRHAPLRHGTMELDGIRIDGAFDPLLSAQARAFAASHARRRGK